MQEMVCISLATAAMKSILWSLRVYGGGIFVHLYAVITPVVVIAVLGKQQLSVTKRRMFQNQRTLIATITVLQKVCSAVICKIVGAKCMCMDRFYREGAVIDIHLTVYCKVSTSALKVNILKTS